MSNFYKKGLTLIEILVVIGLLTVIAAFSISFNLNYLKSDILKTEHSTIISSLQKARSRSMNNLFQTPHGICYIAPNYLIFRDAPGSRCVLGVATNELIPANVSIMSDSGTVFPAFIIFSQLAGTTTPGNIHLTDGIKSLDININYEGTIIW